MTSTALLLAALVVGTSSDLPAQSQSIWLRGRVAHAGSGVPLPGAEIRVTPSGAVTSSDTEGRFEVLVEGRGPFRVTVHRAGFVSATVVIPADAAPAHALEIALDPVAAELAPLVTSAYRGGPRGMNDVPAALTVVGPARIDEARGLGLHDLLGGVPGVEARSRYGTDDVNLGIRGSSARSRQAVRGVVVLLDGIPLTEPDGVARLDLIEVAGAQQIEVLRGPASALYPGSPGGVINVVSRSAMEGADLTVQTQGGGWGLRKAAAWGGWMSASGSLGLHATASSTSSDGYRGHSDAHLVRAQATADYRAGVFTRVRVEAIGSSLESRLPGPLTLEESSLDPAGASPAAVAFAFGRDDRRYRTGLRVDRSTRTDDVGGYLYVGGRTLNFPIPHQRVDLNLRRAQFGGRRGWQVGDVAALRAVIGADVDVVFGDDRRWENPPDGRGGSTTRRDRGRLGVSGVGAYGHFEWDVSADVRATAGVRAERVSYRFESTQPGSVPRQSVAFDQVSPRFSVLWRPRASTSLYASSGRGFEPPAIGEISPSPGAPVREVVPKSLWNHEVGLRHLVGCCALVESAVFVAPVRGDFVPATADGLSFPENASRARYFGSELAATLLPTPAAEFRAAYTLLDLRFVDYRATVVQEDGTSATVDRAGHRLPGVPRHRLVASARLRHETGLRFGVEAEWQSEIHVETGNARRGTWYVVDRADSRTVAVPFEAVAGRTLLHADAALELGTVTLTASLYNLFDRGHVANVVVNDGQGRFYEPGSPRILTVGARVTVRSRGSGAPGVAGEP